MDEYESLPFVVSHEEVCYHLIKRQSFGVSNGDPRYRSPNADGFALAQVAVTHLHLDTGAGTRSTSEMFGKIKGNLRKYVVGSSARYDRYDKHVRW
jgi:hypothetical protein